MASEPYLSMVVHSRNDNHGGNMYRRMQVVLFGFFEQAERHGLRSEIVLVDWNPPADRPLLKDAYRWPKGSRHCTIRVIVVPPSIHRRYPHWETIPVNNDVAKNAAIRRAKGKFILFTSIDDFFPDEIIRFLAREQLGEDKLYRTDCYLAKRYAIRRRTLEAQLDYCRKNVYQVEHFEPWDPHLVINGVLQKWDPTPRLSAEGLPAFHTGRAGDFIVMSREFWHRLRGTTEIDVLGLWSDVLLCHAAYLAGAKLEILPDPMRVYHIDHDSRYYPRERFWIPKEILRVILPPGVRSGLQPIKPFLKRLFPAKNKKEVDVGVRKMPWEELSDIVLDMKYGKRSVIFNDENWGLGQENLDEFVVTQIRS